MNSEEEFQDIRRVLENLRCVTRFTGDWYLLFDRQGLLWYLNDCAAESLGSDSQALIGKHVGEFLPSLVNDFQQCLEKIIASGESLSLEHQISLGGRPKWFLFSLSPVKQTDGKVVALLCTAHDITQRRAREDLIVRSKQDWLRMVDGLPYPLAVVDCSYRIQRVNTDMANRLRMSVRDAVGKNCYKLLHGLGRPPAFCPVQRLHKRNLVITDNKDERLEINEKHLGCDFISVIPLRDSQRNVTGCIYVGHPLKAVVGGAQAEQCIRSLIRKVDHIVRIQDLEGRYLFLSAIEAGNLINAEVRGRTPFDFFEPALASRMVERVQRVASSGGEFTEVSEMAWKGETFHFLDRIFPLRASSGKLLGVVTISKKVAGSRHAGDDRPLARTPATTLSPREREILVLIARGASCRKMAELLGISPKTVQTHRARIMEKLNLHKSSDLTRYAIEAGLL